jgi:transcription elongation factor
MFAWGRKVFRINDKAQFLKIPTFEELAVSDISNGNLASLYVTSEKEKHSVFYKTYDAFDAKLLGEYDQNVQVSLGRTHGMFTTNSKECEYCV